MTDELFRRIEWRWYYNQIDNQRYIDACVCLELARRRSSSSGTAQTSIKRSEDS